jgi:hypothetical protein
MSAHSPGSVHTFVHFNIRYQSRDVIYPVLKGSGFVKRCGVTKTTAL